MHYMSPTEVSAEQSNCAHGLDACCCACWPVLWLAGWHGGGQRRSGRREWPQPACSRHLLVHSGSLSAVLLRWLVAWLVAEVCGALFFAGLFSPGPPHRLTSAGQGRGQPRPAQPSGGSAARGQGAVAGLAARLPRHASRVSAGALVAHRLRHLPPLALLGGRLEQRHEALVVVAAKGEGRRGGCLAAVPSHLEPRNA